MNKKELIQGVLDKLREDLALYHKAAGASRAEATDPQSKAENKYDTRGLEASYLARGQSKQAAEVGAAIEYFEKMSAKDFGATDGIDNGALVELRNGRETSAYFLAGKAGGTEVRFGKQEVLVITPESPLGRQLMGRKAGENCVLELGGRKEQIKILRVA